MAAIYSTALVLWNAVKIIVSNPLLLILAGPQPKFEALIHPRRPPALHPPDETSCSSIQPP